MKNNESLWEMGCEIFHEFGKIFRPSYKPANIERASYVALVDFGKQCRTSYPNITKSIVSVEFIEKTRKYRILQIMANSQGKAIFAESDDVVGQIIYAFSLDDKLTALMMGKKTQSFEIPCHGEEL